MVVRNYSASWVGTNNKTPVSWLKKSPAVITQLTAPPSSFAVSNFQQKKSQKILPYSVLHSADNAYKMTSIPTRTRQEAQIELLCRSRERQQATKWLLLWNLSRCKTATCRKTGKENIMLHASELWKKKSTQNTINSCIWYRNSV